MTDKLTTVDALNFVGNTFIVSSDGSTNGGTGALSIFDPDRLGTDHENIHRFGTKAGIKVEAKRSIRKREVSPKIYFKYVKSKLSEVEIKNLKPRVAKLKGLAEDALSAGQTGLYEKLLEQLALMIREQTASVAGHGLFLRRPHIDKFKNKVQGKVVELCRLEEFPRVLPTDIRKKLKSVQAKGLFDEYWILHTNLTGEKAKSMETKIRDKDPILFGRFAYEKDDRFFYIADWVDEYCDLTLDEFTRIVKGVDEDYEPSEISDPTEEEIADILVEVMAHHKNLQNTSFRNWQATAESDANTKRALGGKSVPEIGAVIVEDVEVSRKPWYKFW